MWCKYLAMHNTEFYFKIEEARILDFNVRNKGR
jgi:hypothetical protein